MPEPLLFVIILSNKRQEDSNACLNSLLQNDYGNFKTLLLEDASLDDSIDMIRKEYPQVQVIPLTENLGYAGNNNIGIRVALEQGADWVLLLNNDIVLDASCLSSLMKAGEEDDAIGIAGPMVYHFDEPGVIQSAGGVLGKNWRSSHLGMNEADSGQFPTIRQVDWVSGCAILARCSLVEQVGALDPDFFLYWEETEWCVRANQAGWKVILVPAAKIWHKGVKRDYDPKPYVTYYMTRNYLFMLAKHKAPFLIKLFAFGEILKTLLSWSIKPRWKYKRDHRDAMWRGLLDYFNHHVGPMPS
jgi:GT2 family glycosyltransferase